MKIKNIENPEEFLKVIDSCTGRVELITDDGDRLNLKSKLCQLVSLSTIFSSAAKIPEMEIVAHELEDSNINEFKRIARTRFYADSFVESIDFDYLDFYVIEED